MSIFDFFGKKIKKTEDAILNTTDTYGGQANYDALKASILSVLPEKRVEPNKTENNVPNTEKVTPEIKKETENKEPRIEEIIPELQINTKLKEDVQNIISLYKEKEENVAPKVEPMSYEMKSKSQTDTTIGDFKPIDTNEAINKEKEIIFKEISEIQNRIKILKERTIEIDKEKVTLVKKEKELYSELTEEEKTIQKLRDFDLPKEYLKLLEKLDKIVEKEKIGPKK